MLTRRSLWLWFILLVLLFLTSGDLPAVAVETPGANRPNVLAVQARNAAITCGGTAGCVTARQVTSDHAALDEPHWLLTFPAGAHVDDYLPLLTELQDYELLRETVRLSERDIVQVTRLTPAARQRLLDAGVTILTDDAASRATLGLTPPDSCTPNAEEVAALTESEIPSFVIDLMQDYVEGYVAPSKYVTATLRSVNNGVKAVSTNLSSSYDGQYRVCFLDMNLLPGDTVDVEVQGDGLRHFTAPTLTLTLNAATDVVSGIAPPNTVITVEVQSYATPIHVLTGTTNLQGSYSVSFSGVYDLQAGTWGQVTLPGEQGERYRVSRYLPSRFSWEGRYSPQLNLNTLENAAAQVKVWNAVGTLQETIDGGTNRIGSVCQSIENVAPGSRIQAEVAGVATAMRVPTFLVEPGNPVVTGTADAGAEITCNTSGYPSVYTTADTQGAFICDFTGVYTPTQGAQIEVTVKKDARTAFTQVYVPVGISVSSDYINVYTRPGASVLLRHYPQFDPMQVITESMASINGWFYWRIPSGLVQPGDIVEVLSAGYSAQVRIPMVNLDVAAGLITGLTDPYAEVRAQVNWSGSVMTTTDASGVFTLSVASLGGWQAGDLVSLAVSNAGGGSVSVDGYVPVALELRSYYSGPSLLTWPNIPGHWQILDYEGQLRAEEVYTRSGHLSAEQLYPGDLISVTTGGQMATLRIPFVEANIASDSLSGLVQPGSRVELQVDGLWGDSITRVFTASLQGTFALNLAAEYNLVPGDQFTVKTQGPGKAAAEVSSYIPARVRIYQGSSYDYVYVYTAPHAPVHIEVQNAAQQLVVSETLTASFRGEIYFNTGQPLPEAGLLNVQTAEYSLSYPLSRLAARINREQDRITGSGPAQATLMVEIGYGNAPYVVQTDALGKFTLDLAGSRDLQGNSYVTVRYFNTEGVEQYTHTYAPKITVNMADNTVTGYYLDTNVPIYLKDSYGKIKAVQQTPADTTYSFTLQFDDISPGDTVELTTPGYAIVLPVPDMALALDAVSNTAFLSSPVGANGTLRIEHKGVRREESYYAGSLALGDDGLLQIPLAGIYDIWNNTRGTFCLTQAEGDAVCATAHAPGLTVNATYDSVSGYAAPDSDVLLTVKRGNIPRGAAQVHTDETGAFVVRGICQGGAPVDIAAGDQVLLAPASSLVVQSISAQLDAAMQTLSGIGPANEMLGVRPYPQREPPPPDGGNSQGYPYLCQIDCQPLPPPEPERYTAFGEPVPVDNNGYFSVANLLMQTGDYALVTYEDPAGNLLRYVAHSTSAADGHVALTGVSEGVVAPSIQAALDVENDVVYGIGPAETWLRIRFISRSGGWNIGDGGGGSGQGGICAIPCAALYDPPDSQERVKTGAAGTFTFASQRDLVAGDYAVITYEAADGNAAQYVIYSNTSEGLQVALEENHMMLIAPLTATLDVDTNTLTVSGVPGTRIQSRFVAHQDTAPIVRCPPDQEVNPGAIPGNLCSLWCEPLQTNIQYIFGGAIQIGATGTVVIPARADLQAGDYAVITYEDEQGNFLRLNVPSTFIAGLNTAATTIPPSVDAWQTLVLTWTVSGGVNHNVSQIYWDTSTHNCDHNYAHELDGARVTTGTYTATLTAPNADALYLRPYAEIDGHQVWAVQETVISINPPPPGADAYEPDDTCAQAHPILTDGTAQQRTFHQYADEDWVWFDVISNTTYTVFASQTGPQADVELDLYDVCTAAPVYTATNTFGPDARLVFTAPGSGRYYLQVYNHDPAAYGPDAHYRLAVRAERPRGLAIIVAGRMKWVDPLQSNINRAANRAYLTFLQRGYTRQDIHYLNVWPNQDVDGNGLQDDVAGIPTIAAIQATIETWTAGRGVGPGVPLYIYLMDHGEVDRFYADINQMVTAEQLNAWLTALEIATGADEITIIVDACNSGSFIDRYIDLAYPAWGLGQISAPNRVIVSSTSSQLLAYATPQGVLFSDAFWAGMREGRSVADSFMRGQTAVIESGHASFQTPWLDDNGNGSPNEPTDGLLAQQRGLLAPLGWEVPEIATVSVSPVTSSGIATITAQIYDNEQLALVEAQIIPPNYTPTLPDDASLPILEVPTLILQTTRGITYTGVYTDFVTPGTYRVVVYAWDETGLTALPHGLEVQGAGAKVYLPLILRQQ